ncbi:hypothetical protein SETIT_3G180800v2 [Setaria italica]|uniref:Uncharacterized protein n=1 Tax=Setaria italica TaxID=4555 RepID=K3Z5E8_SETIT|nr:uncharacterized protein LOC101753218 [Setaria italica]XP_004961509.1 uncharacterized protein LOC101753218 [Setaria italica]RCV16962.1 hypothetical protein SETIT_3G180800v2 [Setaria italica]
MGMANANKRINLTAPLLSVRRHGGDGTETTVTGLPASYKADARSGALGDTGAVPFGWEHRPGHPKSVRTRRPPPVPSLTIIADDDPKRAAQERAAAVIVASERAREEELFSDALSRDDVSCVTVNCSATTVLSDAAGAGARGGPPRARGGSVMMERFLPAAHAVAAGSPQNTFRKATRSPAVASARTGGGDRSPARAQRRLPLQHIAAYHLPPLPPGGGKNEEEEDDDDDAESDAHSTAGFASRRCGWLPSRCVKSARLLSRGSRLGVGRPFLPIGSGSRRGTDPPLLRRSRNGQQQPQHTGDDPGMQSWEEVYIKSLLRSGGGGGGGLMGPAAAVASELDRTVRELYRHRGGQTVQPKPKASHLGLLLVLDRSNEDCGRVYKKYHGSSAWNLPKTGDAPLPLPSTESSPNSGNKLGRGVTGDYGFPLLLEDAEAVAGREMALSPTPLLPLPLPASPTESWLSRALPSVSARPPAATSFLGLHVQPKKHAPLPSWCAVDSGRGADHDRQRQRRVHDLQK